MRSESLDSLNNPRSLLPHPQDELSPAARRAGAPSRFGRRRRTLRQGGKPGALSAGTGPRALPAHLEFMAGIWKMRSLIPLRKLILLSALLLEHAISR